MAAGILLGAYVVGILLTIYVLTRIDDETHSAVWGREGRVHRGELILTSLFWVVSAPVLLLAYGRHRRRMRRERGR